MVKYIGSYDNVSTGINISIFSFSTISVSLNITPWEFLQFPVYSSVVPFTNSHSFETTPLLTLVQ